MTNYTVNVYRPRSIFPFSTFEVSASSLVHARGSAINEIDSDAADKSHKSAANTKGYSYKIEWKEGGKKKSTGKVKI